MAADLQAVGIWPQMVGVVDHPGREPQHLALELAEELEVFFVHGSRSRGRVIKRFATLSPSACRHSRN